MDNRRRNQNRKNRIQIRTKFYVYIVICSDNTLYTGYTNDVDARVLKHNAGKGAKYTRGRLPVVLLYQEEFPTKSEAMKREHQIKQLTHMEKIFLVSEKMNKYMESQMRLNDLKELVNSLARVDKNSSVLEGYKALPVFMRMKNGVVKMVSIR